MLNTSSQESYLHITIHYTDEGALTTHAVNCASESYPLITENIFAFLSGSSCLSIMREQNCENQPRVTHVDIIVRHFHSSAS